MFTNSLEKQLKSVKLVCQLEGNFQKFHSLFLTIMAHLNHKISVVFQGNQLIFPGPSPKFSFMVETIKRSKHYLYSKQLCQHKNCQLSQPFQGKQEKNLVIILEKTSCNWVHIKNKIASQKLR